ncbi:MAG TPA: hypothetical protein DDZ80_28500 [Cyanobacteria bacterium UBA8803]|nr:hypothetical protein [Cyanobacteria bacterium UBA9273]HBL62197.1 hypothetical protein [Cyanobacteria bacterium UBA8803]
MNADEALQVLDNILLPKKLSPIQRLVFRESWLGQTYDEIARNSTYGCDYIKEIGSQLWQDLSQILGNKVTKKNLHLVLNQYQQIGKNNQPLSSPKHDYSCYETLEDKYFPVPETELEFPSGPVPLNSPFYINRPPIEELAYHELTKPGSVIRIKAPTKMGKSSLLNRIIAYGEKVGYRTASLDFQEADDNVFASLEQFLRWFCINISRQLHFKPMLDDYWDEDIGSKVSCTFYFEGYLLKQLDSPLVLALNEVNQVFSYPNIARDFLPLLRLWYERAKQVQVFQKLRLVVAHSTEIYVPLHLNQSPFNVGLPIKLPELTLEQVEELAQRHGLDWQKANQARQLMTMVGGHPYLIRIALYYLCRGEVTLEQLLQEAPTQTGIFSDYLRHHLVTLREEPAVMSAFQVVVNAQGSVCLEPLLAYKLSSMGLVHLEGDKCTPSCELYRLYFSSQNLLTAELEIGNSDSY